MVPPDTPSSRLVNARSPIAAASRTAPLTAAYLPPPPLTAIPPRAAAHFRARYTRCPGPPPIARLRPPTATIEVSCAARPTLNLADKRRAFRRTGHVLGRL